MTASVVDTSPTAPDSGSATAPDSGPATAPETRLVEDAVQLARKLLTASLADESTRERHARHRLGELLADPEGRQLIFALTDEVLRIDSPDLAAQRFADVVHRHPTSAMGRLDRLMLRVGASIAPRLPRLVMPVVVRRIEAETHGIVIPADEPRFSRHLAQRADDGVRINVNPLGEAILSDAEADERMRTVCRRIERSDVDYVSVKVSAIVANLDVFAFDESLDRIADRLRTIYRTAEGATPRTFVNLDMEEYRDLELTLRSFMRVLDEPEFAGIDAGIVLQAYLPDSHDALERLGAWAVARHQRAGGRVKVRLVKGANLAMEAVEAELHGWVAAPYATKADVDASYKAILDSALRPEWADAVRIGLASHNLFDVAWALTIGSHRDVLDRIDFEMLEGMAPAQSRAVHDAAGDLLMYAPVVSDDDFDASIAYLSRRLDENTQPNNFLRSLFTLTPDSPEFTEEADRFRAAVAERHHVDRTRRRAPVTVDVDRDAHPDAHGDAGRAVFENEPDSDMTDPVLRAAFAVAIENPPSPVVHPVDSVDGVDDVLERAVIAHEAGEHGFDDRRRWLLDAAALMSSERSQTIGLMAQHAVKTVHEGDPEISEAIDFCRYYATEGSERLDRAADAGLDVTGRGVVIVVGPWNFPYAIPTGGVAASIAAGNSVILKPAPEVARVGAWIADQFWRAGVPRDVLQLVVCEDGPVGRHLITHPEVDTLVLTGAYETASMFLDWRPDLRVLAETSGKDALIITASADLDQAIADLVRSAFGHAGQKCSAASLGIVVADVYDDPTFRRRLRDAVTSLRVGAADRPDTMVGPLIAPPDDKLRRALTTLEPGESWLVRPRPVSSSVDGSHSHEVRHGRRPDGEHDGTNEQADEHARSDEHDDPAARTWSPGVRVDVAPGSWFHRTECFGPVLGLMRADDLDHAIELQNASDYGLTGGIHSLDDAEVEHWLAHVEIGNAYVNRHITGAIVRRQPFGGWKRSSVGGGAKAGGPGYVPQFARIVDPAIGATTVAPDLDVVTATARFRSAWQSHFCVEHDETGLVAEANILRYRPLDRIAVRHCGGRQVELAVLRIAADVTGIAFAESITIRDPDADTPDLADQKVDDGSNDDRNADDHCASQPDISGVDQGNGETDIAFARRLANSSQRPDRVRLLCELEPEARSTLHDAGIAIDSSPPVTDPMIELQRWVKEQAISRTLHRHGRLVD